MDMRTVLILMAASGLLGIMLACGGTETPVNQPDTSEATPDDVEAEEATPAGEAEAEPEQKPPCDGGVAKGPEAEAGGGEGGEAPAAATQPADDFKGKGVDKAVLGSDKGVKGVTNFDHWKHQKLGVKCFSCHHKGSGRKSCGAGADCHKFKEVNAPRAKDAYHKACNGCHRKKGLPKGCDYCHQPKAS